MTDSDLSPSPRKRSAKEMTEELLSKVDLDFKPQAVIPGDDVTELVTKVSKDVTLGGGLRRSVATSKVRCVRSGILRYAPPSTYWVETGSMKRYAPAEDDGVVGIVEDRSGTGYRVGMFGSMPGSLPILAFEGATKRTKPSLKVGDVVYVRVASAPKDMEPDLSCISLVGPRKGWETGEATFGVLEGGGLFRCTLAQAADLRRHENPTLAAISAQNISFEIVVGANGVVWVKSGSPNLTIVLINALQNSFVLSPEEAKSMVKELFLHLKKSTEAE